MEAEAITIEWERDLSFLPTPSQVYFFYDLVTLKTNSWFQTKHTFQKILYFEEAWTSD